MNLQEIIEEISVDLPCSSSTKEIFEYVWNINNSDQYHFLDMSQLNSKVEKNNHISEKNKKEGNEEFRKRNTTKALELYIKCIMFAENESVQSENLLSLGYANCSAALFDLKYYEESIFCIEKALNLGYPALLKPKLILRLAKCFVALNKINSAKSTLVTFLEEFRHLDEQQRNSLETFKVQLQNLLSECEDEKIVTNKLAALKTFHRDSQDITIKDPHSHIPSASSAVNIQYSESRGRYLCATRNIAPGK